MITVVTRPVDYGSAYRPLRYVFTSDLSPNLTTTNVIKIRKMNSTEVAANPDVSADLLTLRAIGIGSLPKGQHFKISGTVNYDGTYQVEKSIAANKILFKALYIADENVGTVAKYYHNYAIKIRLYGTALLAEFTVKILADNTFAADVSGYIRNYLSEHLHTIGSLTAEDATDEIVREYWIDYAEQYDIPTNGINVLTTQAFTTDVGNSLKATNSALPILQIRRNVIENTINQNMGDFIIDNIAGTRRFLTNQPKTVAIGRNDMAQLSFIIRQDVAFVGVFKYLVGAFDDNGLVVGGTSIPILIQNKNYAQTINISPVDLGLPAAATNYSVYIADFKTGTVILSETLNYRIDDRCYDETQRFFWLNRMGGIDSFTFHGTQINQFKSKHTINKTRINSIPVTFPTAEFSSVNSKNTNGLTSNSGFVDNETAEWLHELGASNYVYMILSGLPHDYIPVVIHSIKSTTNSQKAKTNVTVTYEIAYEMIAQHG